MGTRRFESAEDCLRHGILVRIMCRPSATNATSRRAWCWWNRSPEANFIEETQAAWPNKFGPGGYARRSRKDRSASIRYNYVQQATPQTTESTSTKKGKREKK